MGKATAMPVLTAGTSEVIFSGCGAGSVAYVGNIVVVVVLVVVIRRVVVVVVGKKLNGGITGGGATGFDGKTGFEIPGFVGSCRMARSSMLVPGRIGTPGIIGLPGTAGVGLSMIPITGPCPPSCWFQSTNSPRPSLLEPSTLASS